MPGAFLYDKAAIELFKAKAELVSTTVVTLKDLSEAMDYAVQVALASEPAKLMPIAKEDGASEPRRRKILAAPSIGEEDFKILSEKGEANNLKMVRKGLRGFLAGFEVAFTVADMAVAETASVIAQNEDEDYRLATMICETHVVAVPMAKIARTLAEASDFLEEALAKEANYASIISGASRTADIERVLTLGVHGPLRLHAALMES